MKSTARGLVWLVVLGSCGILWGSCGGKGVAPHDKPTGCHPLAAAGTCILPFPSSYYTREDAQSPTGRRVFFPAGVLPVADDGVQKKPLSPDLFARLSGYSPAAPLVVAFGQRVDPALLIPSTELAKSMEATSPIWLVEFETMERIPLMAEVDRNAKEGEVQAVLIRPMRRLKAGARYGVFLRKTLKAVGGADLKAPEGYVKLARGDAPDTPALAAILPALQETWALAEKAGLSKDDILYAWDFLTASDEPIFARMKKMRDEVLKEVGEDGPKYNIEQDVKETGRKETLRIIRGKIEVPSYLADDAPGGKFLRDEKGEPKLRGVGKFTFQINYPQCAKTATGPLPVMIFGHGLFSTARGEMDSGYHRGLIERLCMIQVGIDWLGLSGRDEGAVGQLLTDFNQIHIVTDRLQQAHINHVAFVRTVLRRFPKDPALQIDGKQVIGDQELYYYGISNGGIQGLTLMALSAKIQRGVLSVPGGNWSMMISRSSNFSSFSTVMGVFYPQAVERQVIIALIQSFFDYTDPITYAPYYKESQTHFGTPSRPLLFQEGIGDAQVPNMATRAVIRSMGIPALKPLFEPVYGVQEQDGPLSVSVYTQYGPRPDPYPPEANLPPKNNPTHEAVRRGESAIKQIESFFKPDGKIIQYCEGSCDPN